MFAHRAYKMSICPKLATPQLLFYFGVLFKYFLGKNTFYGCCYFCRAIHRYGLHQKMHMITFRTYLKKPYFISPAYTFAHSLQRAICIFAYYYTAVFRWAHDMMHQHGDIMGFMYVLAHSCIVTYFAFLTATERRGIYPKKMKLRRQINTRGVFSNGMDKLTIAKPP